MIDTAELDDRIVKCEKILESDVNSQIFAALAEAHRKKGDLPKAREICQRGLKIHPNYASARIVMAKIYTAEENYDRAWEELQAGISESGRTRAMDILESEILIRRGKGNEAKAILQKLYVANPDDETIKGLMVMLGEGKLSDSSPDLVMPRVSDGGRILRKITLTEAINIIRIIPRVLGAVAVNDQGLVIDGRFDGNFDKEEVAALSKEIFDSSALGSAKISLGRTSEILIESSSMKIWMIGRANYLLVVITRDDVSMGSLKLRIDELLHKVEHND
ncbi:MAG: tetratricopeptide repeat protein [candidate division Zixibacteria bacterium]